MKEKKLDLLVYDMKQAKIRNEPGAIVLLGAGCSISAGIPSAAQIVKEVLRDHADHPGVIELLEQAKRKSDSTIDPIKLVQYAELMDCLGPNERNRLFGEYLSKSKINVTHMYLAQLVKEGFVDYILTPNFDNLAQRALALYNIFPPTYDLPNFETLTTQTLNTQSITYLHGTYNGLWQLNTREEMDKVLAKGFVKDIFNKITSNRPWIVIGYSGDDAILEQLAGLGRFNNGLNWVGYKDTAPTERVQKEFLAKENNGTFWIKGYDSDTFFLKLNAALGLNEPKIITNPFSFLKELQGNIIDIQDGDEYKNVKQRLTETTKFVADAIERYEGEKNTHPEMTEAAIDASKLNLKLIALRMSGEYEQVSEYEAEVLKNGNSELLAMISDLYNDWGVSIKKLANTKSGSEAEMLNMDAIEKYEKAIGLNPDNHLPYHNLGNALADLAKNKLEPEAESLYRSAIEKYSSAIVLQPDSDETYNNWGCSLSEFASTKSDAAADELFQSAFDKYDRATKIKPNNPNAFYNWGNGLLSLATRKMGSEVEMIYKSAFEKFGKAIELKPDMHGAYNNWGNALGELAKTKSSHEAELLFTEAFEKYAKAIEIKPDKNEAFDNWAAALIHFARTKTGSSRESLLFEAQRKAEETIALGGNPYNLACCHALLGKKNLALELLASCLEQGYVTSTHVSNDVDWEAFENEPAFLLLKEKYNAST